MDPDLILEVTTLACAAANFCDYLVTRRSGILYFPTTGLGRKIMVVVAVALPTSAVLGLFGVLPSGYSARFALSSAIVHLCYSMVARHVRKVPAMEF